MANATITVLEADGSTQTDCIVLDVGRQVAAASKSAAMCTEDKAVLDAMTAKLPATLGSKADAAALAVTQSTEDKAVLAAVNTNLGTSADAASATGSLSSKLRGLATALGITAFDLGVGTGGSRTLRTSIDSSQIPTAGQATKSASVPVVTPTDMAHSVAVSVTRTADTNAYLASDVIGAATGSTAALTFANMGTNAGVIMITTVEIELDIAAVISGMTSFRLYLYNVTPPSALGDNVAWDLPSGDRASFLGYVDLGTPVDLGSTLYVQTTAVNKQLKLSGTSLFGYLVTIGAYTPASASVFKVTLHSVDV